MTANIFSVLNTAKVGLLAQQLAIEVTGQNIANVQTEGYSRQEVVFEANSPRSSRIGTNLGEIGTGVKVASIKRSHNEFIFSQILGEGDRTGNFKIREEVFEGLEMLFNDSIGRTLSGSLSDFFNGLQDLATNPLGLAERSSILAKGEDLAADFNYVGSELFRTQTDIDLAIDEKITEINTIIQEIAELNQSIHANEPGISLANDLRDSRDSLIKELSEEIDITFIEESDGQVSLTLQNGTPLVLKSTTFSLSTVVNGDNNSFKDIYIDNGSATLTNITSTIQGGRLKGYLDMRDTEIAGIKDKVDILAAGFVREFNRIHQDGFGMDGSTGSNFFAALSPSVFTNTNNTGSAQVAMTNASPSTTSIDEYRITFTGSNSFDMTNLTTGASSGSYTFTTGSTFNLAGGFAVVITGTGATGDVFEFSNSTDAAATMALSSDVTNDSTKIAAGKGTNGDGENTLDLAKLQSTFTMSSLTLVSGSAAFTFDEFYNAIVSTVGIQSLSAQRTSLQQEGVLLQLNNRRESESGVSIDEELINMIKFQQAFNAAARLINVADEMLDALIQQI